MPRSVKIGDRIIASKNSRPFIVAEMSGNHNQSIKRALDIVDAAAQAGVDAVKLQTYTADTLTIDVAGEDFDISDPGSLWKGRSLYELYREAYTPWEWHGIIFKRCKELGIMGFSTPFDETAVDFLEELEVPAYKIASFEINHLPLIKKVASTGKPLIISTGMAKISEIAEAVETARGSGCKDIVLLKCTSTYPALPEESNLCTIPHMASLFDVPTGVSDHTIGIGASIASIALGAVMVEKHFTISREEGGVDSAFSINPVEMKNLVAEAYNAWKARGGIKYGPTKKEKDALNFRRSIYVVEDIKKGDLFTEKNLRIIRPGFGLSPKHYPLVIGKRASCDLRKGFAMNWNYIE